MPARVRPNPVIPDHEVLRKIGGGAYGEVWLARGVTGALRAVKVVWREDFEDERGFEREFEGILKFEPISRDHPALMNILHVGRSPDGKSFYYYVMELGDDVITGRDINPIEYEPRTLRADHQQASGVQWETGICIDVGLRLAEALHHLHERGLAHRDVKPSNVIFVNGKAKLADIGLVAARGQRTFVGTEGFVPPEGPGSAQADVYSLGKVLYEIATGKDRMNFPELPDDMPTGADRKRWLELNKIICDICEPRISKRKITTAADLADALRRIQRGKRRRQSGFAVMLTTLMLAGFACWAGWEVVKDSEWVRQLTFVPPPPEQRMGLLHVFSTPEGADVYSGGTIVGTTPTPTMTAEVGKEVTFTLRKSGYRPTEVSGRMTNAAVDGEPMILYAQLQVFSPPQAGDPWVDHLGALYQPVDDHHVGSSYITEELWSQFEQEVKLPGGQREILKFSQNGQPVEVALAAGPATARFCGWLRTGGIKAGYLTEDHEVTPLRELTFENPGLSARARRDGLRPFRVMVRRIVYGRIQLASNPPGAEVYVNGQSVGIANGPLTIPNVKPGSVDLLLVLEGYKSVARKFNLKEGQTVEENLSLVKNEGVVFGRAWENGIGMRFVPIGPDLMASIWETRVSDYDLFVKESIAAEGGYYSMKSGRTPPRAAFFPQDPDHPVVNVSRGDAMAFCAWLTKRERKADRIQQTNIYRLPTDLEWSLMAGLQEEEGISPGWRDSRKQRVFPWGVTWPDTEKVGNFADMAAGRTPGVDIERTIPGYDDGYPFTAPVGTFPANDLGIFDLSGNVHEWVEDEFSKLGTNVLGVLRGGGWNTHQMENLYTGFRNAVPPPVQDTFYGFRVVLAKAEQKAE
jgi:eukaryotic-like serine/threonine-protein kinase